MKSRLDILDGMRGFAIFLVVLYHETALTGFRIEYPRWPLHPFLSGQWLSDTGFVGVELFFFISGFCLFYPYARHVLDGARKPSLLEFTYRRFIKIVPSYVLALSVLAVVYHGEFSNAQELLKHYLAHVFFLHPWWDRTFYSISAPLWTLGIEVQFYILFPLIAALFMRAPLLTWAAIGILAVTYRAWILHVDMYGFTYYDDQLPGTIDLFATGMLGAYLYVRWRHVFERDRRLRIAATLVAAAAALAGMFLLIWLGGGDAIKLPFGYYHWQLMHRTEMALDCLVFGLASAFAVGGWRELVANPVLVWLSVISYNLYLWHDGVIVYCFRHGIPCALDPMPWQTTHIWQPLLLFGSLTYSLGIATLVTYALERPLLQLRPAWLTATRRVDKPAPVVI